MLVLPYVQREDCLLWQVQTDFYFRLAVARMSLPPLEFGDWPVLLTLYRGDEIIDFPKQLNAFLGAHHVKAIIVDPRDHGPWARLLSEAGLSPLQIGGVLFYKVPPVVMASFQNVTAHEMAREETARSFSALIVGANKYVTAGRPIAKLDAREAQRLKFLALPQDDGRSVSTDPLWWRNLWLGPWAGSNVGVGILGNYEDLQFLVDEYGAGASKIFFPYPAQLANGSKQQSGLLLIVFTPEQLRRAAGKAIGAGGGSG